VIKVQGTDWQVLAIDLSLALASAALLIISFFKDKSPWGEFRFSNVRLLTKNSETGMFNDAFSSTKVKPSDRGGSELSDLT
jgi:hypothetical protein